MVELVGGDGNGGAEGAAGGSASDWEGGVRVCRGGGDIAVVCFAKEGEGKTRKVDIISPTRTLRRQEG